MLKLTAKLGKGFSRDGRKIKRGMGMIANDLIHSVNLEQPNFTKPSHIADQACLLGYHEILPQASAYIYRVTCAQFEEHLGFISSCLSSVRPNLPIPGITFDDGHISNYEHAFPLLERFKLKATFFVLAGEIGDARNQISWSQARELAAAGHSVQSHGWSHRMLTRCGPEEMELELKGSKRKIEDRLGREVVAFSAPGGRLDERVVAACARAGYTHVYHSNPWTKNRLSTGVRLAGRMMVTNQMDAVGLRARIHVTDGKRFHLRSKYAAKEKLRLLLGDKIYHTLWCWIAKSDPEEGIEVQVDRSPHSKAARGA
jgi:hypothetical protein